MLFARLGLPENWRARAQFTLLESDFGEGVSFIRLWELWRQEPTRPARLHFVALSPFLVEAHVLRARLRAQTPPEAHDLVEQLVRQWPLNLPGTHRLEFEELAVTLTLAVGPVERTLPGLAALVDAVLFSDRAEISHGPLASLWQTSLPRLAHDPARLWLALADGQIVQGCQPSLLSSAAFLPSATERMLRQPESAKEARHAVVVGAGIAGAGVAQALALRGWRVQVIDEAQRRTQAHTGHIAAALTPMVTRDDDILARLSRAGNLRAQARWSDVSEEVLWRCGALQLERISGRVVDLAGVLQGLSLPEQWVRYVSSEQASKIAGLPLARGGLYFSTAARIRPERLIKALLQTPGIECVDAQVGRVERVNGQWRVLDVQGELRAQAPQVILASAFGTQALLQQSGQLDQDARIAAMHQLGGEITLLPQRLLAGGPRCIVSGDGYVLPSLDGLCAVGSSYVHGAQHIEISREGMRGNLTRAAGLLGRSELPELLNNVEPESASNQACAQALTGWAGWRAVLPGRLPAIGPIAHAEGLWVATGFASRGLTWSSLAGDLIAGALSGEPLALERDIMDKISQT
jgi:tRNA 5-methylaminomethyl-2-thiouridine biosynthesis bifunctional protein